MCANASRVQTIAHGKDVGNDRTLCMSTAEDKEKQQSSVRAH